MSSDEYYEKLKFLTNGMVKECGINQNFVIRIGNRADDISLYSQIQDAQTRLCEDYDKCTLVSTSFDKMASNGMMIDIYHYTQEGYNLVGEEAGKNISGVYTGRWESRMIGATEVMKAKTMDGSLAAFWTEGEYAFSVVGSKMSDDVFDALLSDVFVDMSEHFYGEAANPLARKTF